LKSSGVASKSAAIQICPLADPGTRFLPGVTIGNLDDRFVVLGDDHFLSGYGLLNQLGKARLCVSDAEPGHGKPSAMHFIMFEDRYHIG
jgi:hypothetical protein